jgi:hypothetical protein
MVAATNPAGAGKADRGKGARDLLGPVRRARPLPRPVGGTTGRRPGGLKNKGGPARTDPTRRHGRRGILVARRGPCHMPAVGRLGAGAARPFADRALADLEAAGGGG